MFSLMTYHVDTETSARASPISKPKTNEPTPIFSAGLPDSPQGLVARYGRPSRSTDTFIGDSPPVIVRRTLEYAVRQVKIA